MRLPADSWVYRYTHGYSRWVFEVRRETDAICQIVARLGIGTRAIDYLGDFTIFDMPAEVLDSWLYVYSLNKYRVMCRNVMFERIGTK